VSAELGRVYRRLFARRQRGDYDDLVQFKDEEVRLWLEEAQDFVSTLTQIVEEQLRPQEPTSSDGD